MRDKKYFKKLIIDSKNNATPEYGGNVMPALKAFKELQSTDEIRAFQDALEEMLEDNDPAVRKFTVTLCLGFFVFRKVI